MCKGVAMKIIVALVIFLFSISCLADQPSVALSQGQPAPYAGVLVDPSRVQRIDNLQLDYDHLQKVDSLKDEDIKVLNDRVNNANLEVQDLSKRVVSQDKYSEWKVIGGFVLGAVLTGAMGYSVYRLAK